MIASSPRSHPTVKIVCRVALGFGLVALASAPALSATRSAIGAVPLATRVVQGEDTLTPLQLRIHKLAEKIKSGDIEERRDALMQLGALHRPEASRAVTPALQDPSPVVRATAAGAVESLPPAEAVTALSPLLSDKDEFVRREATYALGHTRSRNAVPLLIDHLEHDKAPAVRSAAAVALGEIKDESAVVKLADLLAAGKRGKGKSTQTDFISRACARSLGQIGDRAAVPALIDAATGTSYGPDVRREAARALGRIGDPQAVPALQSLLTAPDPHLARAAYEALQSIASRRRGPA